MCVSVCVCIPLITDTVHLSHPPWASQASLIHIPQIMDGYLRRAEASLDPPGQILVNSTRAHRPTRITKAGEKGVAFLGIPSLHSSHNHKQQRLNLPSFRLALEEPNQHSTQLTPEQSNRHSWSLLWVMSTLCRPTHLPTPIRSHYCVYLALMLGERGARVGEGRVGLSSPGPLFLRDPHSGSFSM